ncbi:hypothetical protein DDN40_16830 [Vibrio cholerae]|nr:hypothetical protein [Vibrio cholerae]
MRDNNETASPSSKKKMTTTKLIANPLNHLEPAKNSKNKEAENQIKMNKTNFTNCINNQLKQLLKSINM